MVDRDANLQTVYGLEMSRFFIVETSPAGFLDRDGSGMRQIPGYDTWAIIHKHFWNLGCERRNTQTVWLGVSS